MKKILLILLILVTQFYPVKAEEIVYSVKDIFTDTLVDTFKTYKSAKAFYDGEKNNYDELAILKNDKIITVEFGVVRFTNACDTNYEYINTLTKDSGYTNACYGADALYLDTDETGTKITFLLSGAIGNGPMAGTEIIPLSRIKQLSSYLVIDGRLYHQIKTDLNRQTYGALVDLGKSPDYLQTDTIYLSYDGHYFYYEDQFAQMSTDIRNDIRDNAINTENPYFNYYQYVSHRTFTNVDVKDVQDYFENTLMIQGPISKYNDQDKDSSHDILTQSQYYGHINSFYQGQGEFGANALMMLALSMNESATGRSSLAYTRNNLFGHAAYDSNVEKNASRYLNVNNSVYSHAKNYISKSYLNIEKFQYHGGYFGDKASGMNVSYASDPYWGEKAAQYYLKLDETLGSKDLNAYTLGLKTSKDEIAVYDMEEKELYSTSKALMSFLILDEMEEYYKIQLDTAFYSLPDHPDEFSYDIKSNVGLVLKEDIDFVMNASNMLQTETMNIKYNAEEGTFSNQTSTFILQQPLDQNIQVEEPILEGYIFDCWIEKNPDNWDSLYQEYTATYKKIIEIKMNTLPVQVIEYDNRIIIEGGLVEIKMDEGSKIIPLTTSMISGYDLKTEGQQIVTVNVAGAQTSYPIEVIMELDTKRTELTTSIEEIIAEMSELSDFSDEQIQQLISLKEDMIKYVYPYTNFNNLRKLDAIFKAAFSQNVTTVIIDNDLDIQYSGLYLAIDSKTLLEGGLFKDIIRLDLGEVLDDSYDLLKKVAVGNGWQTHYSFALTGKMNVHALELEDYILVSIPKPNSIGSNQIVSVLQYIDGEVVKLATQQTDGRIIFKTNQLTSYIVTARNSTNEYTAENIVENVTYADNGFNIFEFLIVIVAICIVIILIAIRLLIFNNRKSKKNKSIK